MNHATSRRNLLKAGVGALAGASVLLRAASARALQGTAGDNAASGESNAAKEQLIRAYYSAFEKKQWSPLESLLADSFTFSSPFDDHIDKSAFKERCWPTSEMVVSFEVECMIIHGNDGFTKYLLKTKDGKALRNTEYYRFAGGRIKDIECYFGGKLGYPGQPA